MESKTSEKLRNEQFEDAVELQMRFGSVWSKLGLKVPELSVNGFQGEAERTQTEDQPTIRRGLLNLDSD